MGRPDFYPVGSEVGAQYERVLDFDHWINAAKEATDGQPMPIHVHAPRTSISSGSDYLRQFCQPDQQIQLQDSRVIDEEEFVPPHVPSIVRSTYEAATFIRRWVPRPAGQALYDAETTTDGFTIRKRELGLDTFYTQKTAYHGVVLGEYGKKAWAVPLRSGDEIGSQSWVQTSDLRPDTRYASRRATAAPEQFMGSFYLDGWQIGHTYGRQTPGFARSAPRSIGFMRVAETAILRRGDTRPAPEPQHGTLRVS